MVVNKRTKKILIKNVEILKITKKISIGTKIGRENSFHKLKAYSNQLFCISFKLYKDKKSYNYFY